MSGAAVQISRGALAGLSAGAGSLYMYANGIVPPGLSARDLMRFGVPLTPGIENAAGQQAGNGQDIPAYLKPLADQLGELSGEVARMRLQNQYAGGYYYSQGWGVSWTTVATVGGIGVLVLYVKGYSFADFMYVTKKALEVAVEALEQGIENLGTALETTKRELSYKLGLVEEKVDETRASLERKIADEVGDVKRELNNVGSDVKGISRAQGQVHGMVQSIETQIDVIENRMQDANDQLSTANRGIYLLCNVVAESMNGKAGPPASNNRSLYEELMAYTRNAVAGIRPAGWGAAPANSAPAIPAPAAQGEGIKFLAAEGSSQPSSALDVVPGFREMLSSNSFRLSQNQDGGDV